MKEYTRVMLTHIAWTLGIFLVGAFYIGPALLENWLRALVVVAVVVGVMMYYSQKDNENYDR